MSDLEMLGAQFREAQEAISVHRVKQAKAEMAFAETLRRHGYDDTAPDVVAALVAVDKAVEDVVWCQAVTVAAGEAYKGEPFTDVVARNEAHRGA